MNQELSHILEQSVCLSKRQLADYIAGRLEQEELHAVETHLLSCPLCSMATEGLSHNPPESLAALSSLNSDFLKEHFEKSLPQIHLNSVVAAAIPSAKKRKAATAMPLFRTGAIAAGLMLCIWGAWALTQKLDRADREADVIAANTPSAQPQSERRATAPVPADVVTDAQTIAQNAEAVGAPAPAVSGPATAPAAAAAQESAAGATAAATSAAPKTPPAPKTTTGSSAAINRNGLGAGTGNSYEPAVPTIRNERLSAPAGTSEDAEQAGDNSIAAASPKKTQTYSRSASAPESAASPANAGDRLKEAKDSYEQGDFKEALAKSKAATAAAAAEDKDEASIVTARSYIKLGQKERARAILLKLKDGRGASARQARRLLRQMDKE
jgi:hypothetical protein